MEWIDEILFEGKNTNFYYELIFKSELATGEKTLWISSGEA